MNRTTPFKAEADFEQELKVFANKYKSTLAEHSKRISDYFEMSCYHLIIRYYETRGYQTEVQNLIHKKFRFKCSPVGLLSNFSFFKATKTDKAGKKESVFIFHNATVQSAFDKNIFTTPDIVVSKTSEPSISTNHYASDKMRLSYVSREDLVTFCEAKHLMPFPELMVGFIGTVLELKPECITGKIMIEVSDHLAPSLMMSGTYGKPTSTIRDSFEKRYYVNLLDNLFDPYTMKRVVSKTHIDDNATLGKKSERTNEYDI